jgi:hypothetical protein
MRADDWMLVVLSAAGFIGGLAWALLGARNWEYCRRMVGELIHVGGRYQKGSRSDLYQILRELEEGVHGAWRERITLAPLSHYPTVVAGTPIVVAALYLALLFVLLLTSKPPGTLEPWLLPCVLLVVALIPLSMTIRACYLSVEDANKAVEAAKKSVNPDDR